MSDDLDNTGKSKLFWIIPLGVIALYACLWSVQNLWSLVLEPFLRLLSRAAGGL